MCTLKSRSHVLPKLSGQVDSGSLAQEISAMALIAGSLQGLAQLLPNIMVYSPYNMNV